MNKILISRRSKEERVKNHLIATNKQIEMYIKNGSKGDLNLGGTPIKDLGNLQKVRGDLNLIDTPIKDLGNLTRVGGYLALLNTPIKDLGNLTHVGGHLDLRNSQIEDLGNLTHVRDDLYLRNTPISKKYSKEDISKMIRVDGDIYLY